MFCNGRYNRKSSKANKGHFPEKFVSEEKTFDETYFGFINYSQ